MFWEENAAGKFKHFIRQHKKSKMKANAQLFSIRICHTQIKLLQFDSNCAPDESVATI
jgi:hypothetical protein